MSSTIIVNAEHAHRILDNYIRRKKLNENNKNFSIEVLNAVTKIESDIISCAARGSSGFGGAKELYNIHSVEILKEIREEFKQRGFSVDFENDACLKISWNNRSLKHYK